MKIKYIQQNYPHPLQILEMNNSVTIPQYCDFIQYLGSGSYGDVSKCYSNKHMHVVAVKRVKMENNYPSVPPTTLREVSILNKLNNSHTQESEFIVKLIEVNYDQNNMFLIFEFCDTDMENFFRKQQLNNQDQKKYCKQLLLGVKCIHENECIHRDLKPSNILLKSVEKDTLQNAVLKIADFGLARSYAIQGQTSSNVASLWYKAPELVLQKTNYGPEVDVWSAGCCIYKFVTGKTLFLVQNEEELLDQICFVFGGSKQGNWPQDALYRKIEQLGNFEINIEIFGTDPDFVELMMGMLCVDPQRRITVQQALQMKWFDGV